MKFENMEDYVEEDLMMRLSQNLFQEEAAHGRRVKTVKRLCIPAAAACAAMILILLNFGAVSAAAKGLAAFLFGGIITEESLEEYYVLKEAVEFGRDGEYRLELAYRDKADVYAVITGKHADGIGAVSLEVGGTVYEDVNRGSSSYTVSEMDGESGTVSREKSQSEYHFTQVGEGQSMTFILDGQRVDVRLESPERFAGDHGPVMETAGTSWIIWPLSPDYGVVGISLLDTGENPWLETAESTDLLNPVFIGASGRQYRAEPVGEGNHVWKISDSPQDAIAGFRASGIAYTLADRENGLAVYRCRVPERNQRIDSEGGISVNGLDVRVEGVERSAQDHISLFMEPETEGGELHGGSLNVRGASGYGSASGGDSFVLSAGFTYHIMDDDRKTVRETVYGFPFEAGEEMELRIDELELHLEGESGVMFR